eukprot:PhF_6_TR23251/c0_g1_i1/m.32642/K07442/TRM61, GCD14; tRNA (adenine57-N1/adenine58-N1)-methyltransferase catalytic subunit
MITTDTLIKEGDLVIISSGYGHLHPTLIKSGGQISIKDGLVRHRDVISKPFGSKLDVRMGPKLVPVHLLRPTPEMWTLSLPHRTQIIFTIDIAAILFHLDVKPGWHVLEAGTGSGSLTHSFARAVYPTGKVVTCEFHQGRYEEAQKEFQDHKLLGSVVESRIGDISAPSTLDGLADQSFDSIFLDVPKPWTFFENKQDRVLRGGGMFCGFSPCIEQTEKTATILRESGQYIDVKIIECIGRKYDIVHTTARQQKRVRDDDGTAPPPQPPQHYLKPQDGGLGHSAFLTFARKLVKI